MEMVTIQPNLVDQVWGSDKPPMPEAKVFEHLVEYSGLETKQKIEKVQEKLKDKVDVLLVTTLDDINWLLNLRGNDIQCNPVFFSYAIIHIQSGKVDLFMNKNKLSDDINKTLESNNVTVHDYETVADHLKKLVSENVKIGFDENICNQKLYESFEESKPVHQGGIVELIKAAKNPVEQDGMRRSNIRNSVSLIQYFAWLEDHLKHNPETVLNEYTAAEKLEEFRKLQDRYVGPSFETISSMGPNGAVIHYKPEPETALKMTNKEIYLLDSGV